MLQILDLISLIARLFAPVRISVINVNFVTGCDRTQSAQECDAFRGQRSRVYTALESRNRARIHSRIYKIVDGIRVKCVVGKRTKAAPTKQPLCILRCQRDSVWGLQSVNCPLACDVTAHVRSFAFALQSPRFLFRNQFSSVFSHRIASSNTGFRKQAGVRSLNERWVQCDTARFIDAHCSSDSFIFFLYILFTESLFFCLWRRQSSWIDGHFALCLRFFFTPIFKHFCLRAWPCHTQFMQGENKCAQK